MLRIVEKAVEAESGEGLLMAVLETELLRPGGNSELEAGHEVK